MGEDGTWTGRSRSGVQARGDIEIRFGQSSRGSLSVDMGAQDFVFIFLGVRLYRAVVCVLCVERISDASRLVLLGSASCRIRGGVKAHAPILHICTGMIGRLTTHASIGTHAHLRLFQPVDLCRCLAQAELVCTDCVFVRPKQIPPSDIGFSC